MTKELLEQYPDICEELEELGRPVTDTVVGSAEEFPYTAHPISVKGVPDDGGRHAGLEQQRDDIKSFVAGLRPKERRIVTMRALKGYSWAQVTAKMGHRYTINRIKKIYYGLFK